MNMLVLMMLYPVVFVFGALVQKPLLVDNGVPFWLALFIGNVVSVALLNWLVPWSARRFDWWLAPQRPAGMRINLIGAGTAVGLVCLVCELAIGALANGAISNIAEERDDLPAKFCRAVDEVGDALAAARAPSSPRKRKCVP